jgi:chromosome segregation ATPase
MELAERLQKIELAVRTLQIRYEELHSDNEQLKAEIAHYKELLHQKEEILNNLEEQNKITKLAGGQPDDDHRTMLKAEIDDLIAEIDQCIKLVNK